MSIGQFGLTNLTKTEARPNIALTEQLKHISTLNSLLASAKRAYLNVDANQTFARKPRTFDLSATTADGRTDPFAGVKYLTNEERDQIDLQGRILLSKCAERVKEMEALEKREHCP